MPLTETAIAEVLRTGRYDKAFLVALAASLDQPAAPWRLRLTTKRPGRRKSYAAGMTSTRKVLEVGKFVQRGIESGRHKKAAVMDAADHFAVSESYAYEAHKDWEASPKRMKILLDKMTPLKLSE